MTDFDLGTTIVLIVSSVVIIIGIWVIKDSLLKKKRCNKETKGQIIGYQEILSRDEDKRSRTTYYCKYRYSIGNTNFEDRSDVGLNSKIFKVGSKITIRYNPENHRQHYIVESSPLDTKINIGVLFVFLGLLFFIPLVWKICK